MCIRDSNLIRNYDINKIRVNLFNLKLKKNDSGIEIDIHFSSKYLKLCQILLRGESVDDRYRRNAYLTAYDMKNGHQIGKKN